MPVMGFTKFERFLRAAWLAAASGPAHPPTGESCELAEAVKYLVQGGGAETAAVWAAPRQVYATLAVAAAIEAAAASQGRYEIPGTGSRSAGTARAPASRRRPAARIPDGVGPSLPRPP